MTYECRYKSPPEPEPGPGLRVRVHRTGSDLVVELTGELRSSTAEILRASLTGALRAVPGPRVVLDLSGARLADRFGLGILVALRNAADRAGGRMILVRPPAEVLALLAETGLDRHLHACHSLELAGTRMPGGIRTAQLLPVRGPDPQTLSAHLSHEPTGRQPAPEGTEA
ncbi:anti-anti-sigma factor [Thermomonospora echinospora]|uniref:Anti-anti-sigma factor n=1 Tax=Thermomonospora echinospora TaxID=1992 RepID=A0A1H6C998_9ACTN|nr:STAS domain-containing protein [Thermomonospora echinospora]SEG69550.1 anti-anti-sigma factor [Thermomonospora echinospora]